MRRFNIVFALCLGLCPLAGGATVLDFSEFANDGSPSGRFSLTSTFVTQGYRFTPSVDTSNSLAFWSRGNEFNADPGGAALATNIGDQTLRLARIDGGLFDFAGIGIAHVYGQIGNVFANPTVTFTFNRDGGSTSSVIATTTRFLTPYSFNETGLRSIDLAVDRFAQFDNVAVSKVSAVPEPASWALLLGGFGIAGLGLRATRWHRNQFSRAV